MAFEEHHVLTWDHSIMMRFSSHMKYDAQMSRLVLFLG